MKIIKDHGTYVEVETSMRQHKVLLDVTDYVRLATLGIKNLSVGLYRGEPQSIVIWHDKRTHRLGRFITTCPDDLYVDHIDRNQLNNRFGNLRTVSHRVNCLNRGTTLKEPGAYKQGSKWLSYICIDGRSKYLGSFDTKEQALECYRENTP